MNDQAKIITTLHLADPKPCRLLFTNRWKEKFYFVTTGDHWPHNPSLKLISDTTPDHAKARVFPSIADALAVLKGCGEPDGWEVIPENA